MRSSSSLVRIAPRLGVLAAGVVVLLGLVYGGLYFLSGVRAYVAAESEWAKAQKQAVIALHAYVDTRDPAALTRFDASLAVPRADRLARVELENPRGDVGRARRAIIAGGSARADAPQMVALFRHFGWVGPFRQAIAVWRTADAELVELEQDAARLHAAEVAGRLTPAIAAAAHRQLDARDARLTAFERTFGAALGEGARFALQAVMLGVGVAGLILVAFGALLLDRIERQRQRSVAAELARAQAAELFVEHAPDAVLRLDRDLRHVYANAAAERALGVTAAALAGRRPAQVGPLATAASSLEAACRTVLATGRSAEVALCLEASRGPTWLDVRLAPEWDAEGTLASVLIIARDVTAQRVALDALREREALLSAVLEGTTDAMWVKDAAGVYRMINGPGARMIGQTVDAVIGRTEADLFTAESAPQLRERDLAVLASGVTHTGETASTDSATGVARTYVTTRAPLRDAGGHVVGVIGVSRDITARKAAERALGESEGRFRGVVERSPEAIVLHADGQIVYANPACATLIGVGDPAEILRVPVLGFVAPESRAAVAGHLAAIQEGRWPERAGGYRLVRPDGRRLDVEVASVPITYDGRPAVQTHLRDVTERNALEAQLTHQAFHDPLTGLANRALFRDRVTHALEHQGRGGAPRGEDVAIVYLDLDDFKQVNDACGHAAGDELLGVVAQRLLRATRGSDTVARLGGDEFAVLLEGLAASADAEVAVERITRALAAPALVDGRETAVGASVGLVHAGHGATADELLRDADTAMYRAKAAGKGRAATFAPAMREAVLARHALERDLRTAVADPASAFHLVFQPVVALETGAVAKFEALLRWHHPQRGPVSPAQFVPVAEEMGLIVPLGRWVLEAACRQMRVWDDALPPPTPYGASPAVHLTVNVSGRQLDDAGLVADVAVALAASAIAPERLTLEVTETALMRDTDRTLAALHALKALGVRLAIDDFGTGYSSLAYLQRFPVDMLKIDKSFVDGVAHGGPDAALARTVVALGQTLGLRTVAEGIETEAQRAALAALGCPLGQGYLFARPLSADAAHALVASVAPRPFTVPTGA